ncbi:MspA family porin [Gordonia sp. CPCC 206044]|uniref:MspA family porin n=1 Tax=Gordonia sp. CPCC 206044 TaxID=3140793 RepID=UPI003AF3D609
MNKIVSNRFSRNACRAGAVVVGLIAAAPLLGQGVAQADTQVRLPNQTVVKRLNDGSTLTITRTNERARINPSLGGTPLHRNAWVSGRYDLKSSDKKSRIGIGAGYIVGCQMTFGAKSTTDGKASPSLSESGGVNITGTASTGGSVTIGPGQAAMFSINDAEYQDPFGSRGHSKSVKFRNGEGALAYTNATMMINGCAGYAQARSFAKVSVQTEKTTQVVNLYGKPFSLG